ncbi:hypothetical protein, partial [Sphingomonas jeddahensis]|uniref:hypothetical protein n=1 Tax=Sphingomonas jeddahensis TaxID=1915074 RepID=UPI001E555AEC
HSSLVLTQHAYDLILGKTASPHRSSPSDQLTYQWHDFRGAGQCAFTCVVWIDEATGTGPAPAISSSKCRHIPRDRLF